MFIADEFKNWETQTEIDGKWVLARPIIGPFISRIKDAWQVLIGKADAVKFIGQ
jgi:hypothetical protein